MKKLITLLLFCFGLGLPAFAQANQAPSPYTSACNAKEDAAEFKFLSVIQKANPSEGDYSIIYKLVRNYTTGFFKNHQMRIYVTANGLYVIFADNTEFLIDRRVGECLIRS